MDLGRHFEASPSASSGGGGEGLVDMDSVWMPGGPASASAASLPQPAYLMPQQHGQVMTEEQLETLRRQISVYATICQQLVEMHKATVSQQHTFNGLVLGHQAPPQDSSILGMHHKTTSRQRWTPSQNQLRILERLFKQGNGTPNRQRIKEITGELSQHGQISETNVYNWFQNRKARAKRKQRHASQKDAGESEVETDGDSPEEKRNKVVDHPENNITTDITSSNPFEDDNRYSVVMLNEKAWKVRPGRLNVRSNFGENAVLLDPRGHVVAMNEAGLTLHPLQPAGTYTVAGLEGGGGTSHSPTLLDPGKTFQQQQQQQATTLTSSSRAGGLQTRNRIYH